MKILKLSPYYTPEQISSSHLTEDLEQAYAAAGITTELFVPTPTRGVTPQIRQQYKKIQYEEKMDRKVLVHRFPMFCEGRNPIQRALRYILVNIIQFFKGSGAKDIDVVMGASTPPTQGALCALVAKRLSKRYGRKVPFVFALHDVFPDSLVAAGLAKKNSFLYNIGTKIADYTYRNADAIIAISEDIKRNIIEKGVPEEKIHVIYNWIDTEKVRPVKTKDNKLFEELGLSGTSFKVVYAGNLGKVQGLGTLLDAANILKDQENIEFLIFGKGVEEEALKKRAQTENIANVRFFPLLPLERVPEVYSLGDVCVVSCKKGTGEAGVPSKTWSIMACGKPLLVSFDGGSELCRTVEKAEAGLCCPPEDAAALAQKIVELYTDPEKKEKLGHNAHVYAVEFADRKTATGKYISVIEQTVKRGQL